MEILHTTAHGSFSWDSEKEQANVKKHKIDFILSVKAFADDHAIIMPDKEHSVGEERFKLVGVVNNIILLLVVFTDRDVTRIISARKATKYEEKQYARCTR